MSRLIEFSPNIHIQFEVFVKIQLLSICQFVPITKMMNKLEVLEADQISLELPPQK